MSDRGSMTRASLITAGILASRPTEMIPEVIEVHQAKLDAEERAHRKARRERVAIIENKNAAKSDSAINRHTGKPHEHNRAKARHLKATGSQT